MELSSDPRYAKMGQQEKEYFMEKKLDYLLKNFLSQKLAQHKIPPKEALSIIHEAALVYDKTNTDEEIEEILNQLSQKFSEIHILAETFHWNNLKEKRKQFEEEISQLIPELMLNDENLTLEILHFVENPEVTRDMFYDKYPQFKENN